MGVYPFMVRDEYQLKDFDHITTKTADGRGRVTLGNEYADRHVFLCAIDVTEDIAYSETPSDEEREKLTQLSKWARENDITPADYDVENGRVLSEGAEWIDTDVEGLNE